MRQDKDIHQLIRNNRSWVKGITADDPQFFARLSKQQRPNYLWIGCADSRVPANEIVGMLPGELFVHRNVANLVVHTDLNCLSVLQYTVDVLQVRHVIVCGHYGCGGVSAAYDGLTLGLIDNWLRHVQDIRETHRDLLARAADVTTAHAVLSELNVIEQVRNVCRTTIVQEAWRRGQELCIHGWIYDIADGLIRELGIDIDDAATADDRYMGALERLSARV